MMMICDSEGRVSIIIVLVGRARKATCCRQFDLGPDENVSRRVTFHWTWYRLACRLTFSTPRPQNKDVVCGGEEKHFPGNMSNLLQEYLSPTPNMIAELLEYLVRWKYDGIHSSQHDFGHGFTFSYYFRPRSLKGRLLDSPDPHF